MSAAAPAAPIEDKPLSQVERVVDTFIAPTKAFSDLRRSANWLVPFLVLVVFGIALVVVVDQKLGMEKVVENGLALQPKAAARLDQLSPEQRAAQMETIIKFNRVVSYLFPLILLVLLVVFSAVLLGTFNFGMGAELKFNQSLTICVYASLPGVVKGALAMLVVAMGAGENFTFQNPIASNLSGLVDPSSHFLYALASNVDVFMIWTLILAAIGYSCLTKVKRGTCMAVVFGWWVIWVLGTSGVAAAFS
jgi:Yip1-like protein